MRSNRLPLALFDFAHDVCPKSLQLFGIMLYPIVALLGRGRFEVVGRDDVEFLRQRFVPSLRHNPENCAQAAQIEP